MIRTIIRSNSVAFLAGVSVFLAGSCGPAGSGGEPEPKRLADIVSVKTIGAPGAYRFAVGISSPDTGCDQYADWWEVLTEDGRPIYRRILAHSHVDEQPFVRDGGPIDIEPDQVVWVRAHMNREGYGGKAAKGSVQTGFEITALAADFAAEVATRPPLPEGCRF